MRWGSRKARREDFPKEALEKHGEAYCRKAGLLAFQGGGTDSSARIGTPKEFRELLIGLARSVKPDFKLEAAE